MFGQVRGRPVLLAQLQGAFGRRGGCSLKCESRGAFLDLLLLPLRLLHLLLSEELDLLA